MLRLKGKTELKASLELPGATACREVQVEVDSVGTEARRLGSSNQDSHSNAPSNNWPDRMMVKDSIHECLLYLQ